jgi:C1A family cysteine protease
MSSTSRTYLSKNLTRLSHDALKFKSLGKLKQTQLPPVVDLRPNMPPIVDQGSLGSCTANALAAIFQKDDLKFTPSRLFIYYNERLIENDVSEDGGAQLSDGIQSLVKYGVCSESSWPYDIQQFKTKPPEHCYVEAEQHQVLEFFNIRQDMNSMKNCLFSGYPFVVGILVFEEIESYEVAHSGMVPMPTEKSNCIGGHAVTVVGYDDSKRCWLMRNSWGTSWGIGGYFYVPYEYLLDSSLASDLWEITKVEV